MLVEIIAILAAFGMPAFVIHRMLQLRERKLELQAGANKKMLALAEERNDLRDRVAALEEIVHGGDFELNQQLKKIAREQADKELVSATAAKSLPSSDSRS